MCSDPLRRVRHAIPLSTRVPPQGARLVGCWEVGRLGGFGPGGVSSEIYNWRQQDEIDRGEAPGLSSTEQVELKAARRRIVELETELAVTRRANELLKAQVVSPKDVSRQSR